MGKMNQAEQKLAEARRLRDDAVAALRDAADRLDDAEHQINLWGRDLPEGYVEWEGSVVPNGAIFASGGGGWHPSGMIGGDPQPGFRYAVPAVAVPDPETFDPSEIPEIHCNDSMYVMADAIYINAKAHGFHDPHADGHVVTTAERLMLIVTECAEAMEELRKPELDREAFGAELADIIIRTLDLAVSEGIDIEEAVVEKHAKNRLRPVRHGGKKL